MFRILVADDEKVTRRGIVTMLERGLKEEVEYIEASNGEEALEIVQQQMIHLIVTDICMPLCSGLEFVGKLREKDNDMTVIIISGYENFEYAKQAVRLGVKDYIMKPLHKEELLGLVENCIADIQKKQIDMQKHSKETYRQNRILKDVEREAILQILEGKNIVSQLERLDTLNIVMRDSFFFTTVIEYERNQRMDDIIDFAVKNIVDEYLEAHVAGKFCSAVRKHGQIAVLFWISEIKQKGYIENELVKMIYLIENMGRMKAIAGVGELVFTPEELRESFRQGCVAADCKIFNMNDKLLKYSAIPQKIQKASRAEEERMGKKGWNQEEEILNKFTILIKMGKSVEVIELLREEYGKIYKQYDVGLKKNGAYVYKDFSEFWSEFELRREVREILQFISGTKENGNSNHQIVKDIIAFTRQHVTEDINLNGIAGRFGKTPGYIGTLFRRETGQGFNEFVTGERIRVAKKLLQDHTLSVQKVGEMCGYYNPKYFSIVFKKTEGISPKAYQMMQRQED